MYVLKIVVCPVVPFHLAIVLSVLLRCTDSDIWYLQCLLAIINSSDLTLKLFPEHLTSPADFCGVPVTQYLVFRVVSC